MILVPVPLSTPDKLNTAKTQVRELIHVHLGDHLRCLRTASGQPEGDRGWCRAQPGTGWQASLGAQTQRFPTKQAGKLEKLKVETPRPEDCQVSVTAIP